jgi:hypothetical protein
MVKNMFLISMEINKLFKLYLKLKCFILTLMESSKVYLMVKKFKKMYGWFNFIIIRNKKNQF